MLEEIHIRGLGVIDDAVLTLAPGLTVISGETGAGKTMVVTGLGLLFGGRADAGAVRPGAETAAVEGRLRVSESGPVAVRAAEAGGQLDEGVLLRRTVSGDGRSRAYVGGSAVPVGVLAELARWCVAVHGQSDQSRLLQPAQQRTALDRYAGTEVRTPLAAYRSAYDELVDVRRTLDELTTRAQDRAQEADLLRFGLEEVAAISPQPGEAASMAVEEERLGSADALLTAAATARIALLGGDSEDGDQRGSAASLVDAARAALEQPGVRDPALAELVGRLREFGYLLADVGSDLASYAAGVDTDPARLAAVQERRAALTRLIRKYADTGAPGSTPDPIEPPDDTSAVLDWSRAAAARLATLEGDDDRIGVLAARREELLGALAHHGSALSAARRAAADRFAAAVSTELVALAMPHAAVEVTVSPAGSPDSSGVPAYGRHGLDDVEILLRPHAGASARPLQRGASGGELSRVMLAVEVVFAGSDPVPTLVFDEVDAGVGGRAAVEVGRRLAALARTAQVLVVTHLPQVAAFADRHLVVRKTDDGTVTSSGVLALDGAQRLQELSRMLAGVEESRTARAHARALLASARELKQALIP